nr:bifunctional homocysteine S-methyltransferase/methylenetetrahydrofolate reductase [uncultured Holophaga sp.]
MHRILGAEPFLIADGAMGTYFAQITGEDSGAVERANLERPWLIERIHREYIEAGARLIRTNTFGASCPALGADREEVSRILRAGVTIARRVAGDSGVLVAASIGPIPTLGPDGTLKDVQEDYRFAVDTLLEEGVECFIFETFSSPEQLSGAAAYLRRRAPGAFILAQFATTPEGLSRTGVPNGKLVRDLKALGTLDGYGFNCGIGPTHLLRTIQRLELGDDLVSVMPNAGYPEVENERTIYRPNPAYFAERMREIHRLGARILGGCCGSTPEHIRALAGLMGQAELELSPSRPQEAHPIPPPHEPNPFAEKLQRGDFVVAVELDPPFDADASRILAGARRCREAGVDLVTVADSPMARARLDSLVMAARIQREAGIQAMPHVCCRDKNLNALKSGFLAAHMEGLRNILAVTGDAIPAGDRAEIKAVFNLNSFRLIEFLSELNAGPFLASPFLIGGALNLNAARREAEVARMVTKVQRGASLFLTQPIYSREVIDYLAAMPRPKGVKILGGILPLVSYRNAQFLNNEMPGIQVPQEFIDRFHPGMSREEAESVGVALAVEVARELMPQVDGFYFMTPFNKVDLVLRILEAVRLSR